MKLPKVKRGIFSSIIPEIVGPQEDPHWTDNMYTHISIENPILAEYLAEVKKKYGEPAAIAGLVMYRAIESQMEADELTELMGE